MSGGHFDYNQDRIDEIREDIKVIIKDFIHQIIISEYTFDDIILHPKTKKIVFNWLEELKNIQFLINRKLPVLSRGLFYGPSGTGKTMLAYCIAHELAKPLFVINLASIVSSKLGETSRNLDYAFRVAKEKGAILFLDEIDFFAIERDSIQDHGEARRSLIALFQILDLISNDIIVIAATNLIDSLDSAIIRRFGFKLNLSKPTKKEIKVFIKKLMKDYGFTVVGLDRVLLYFGEYNYTNIKDVILGTLKMKLLSNRKINKISIKLTDIEEFNEGLF